MSLFHMQKALALLIRLPDENRKEKLSGFLDQFDLSDRERKQLEILASEYAVHKYGRSMANVRGGAIERHLFLSRHYLDRNFLLNLVRREFDPMATHVRAYPVALRFLEFVEQNSKVRDEIAHNAPEFIFDMFQLEKARVQFRIGQPPDQGELPRESLLRHSHFALLSLSYDLLPLLGLLKNPKSLPNPKQRKVSVLVTPREDIPDSRMFEIDFNAARFIRSQIDGKRQEPLPESYSDLVSIGLCQPSLIQ